MNENKPSGVAWSSSVIIADADYVDKVAFNLIVNFERMIGRPIPPADMARWLVCVALDGGLRPGETIAAGGMKQPESDVQAVLIHRKDSLKMANFQPSTFEKELDGQAFTDRLGEFSLAAPAVEPMVDARDFFLDIVGTVCAEPSVRRVMIVPNAEEGTLYDDLRETLRHVSDDKRVTVFTMEPLAGGNFRQEILGYSLMAALGISSSEIPR